MTSGLFFKSFAKINWLLRVLGKRDDNFHEICTVFQTVSVHDTLYFEEADEVGLTCDDPTIPTDEANLIVRSALKLQERTNTKQGAAIHLEKRIPAPGGLGGGSSNAAVALIGLNRLWDLGLSIEELCSIGTEIGSDVVFFFAGGTAIGTERGDVIERVADVEEEFMIIVTPKVSVSTAAAFAGLSAPALTKSEPESILTVCRNAARSLDPRDSELKNDFERSIVSAYPEVARLKEILLELGAVKAAMSGSGASIFAIFDNEETRQTALIALDQESSWRKFAVSTVSRAEYRESLGI
ncbi:MAG: 4-(cytidine 5'-diphospho)-2-C-methyl-D-erythritol kinase [Blastocatellia bacterium]|nr:4-(cytidine 5'-diphospho)-2-C-methyl-D-erythritol kinase [Blastocatellia bacterium]